MRHLRSGKSETLTECSLKVRLLGVLIKRRHLRSVKSETLKEC